MTPWELLGVTIGGVILACALVSGLLGAAATVRDALRGGPRVQQVGRVHRLIVDCGCSLWDAAGDRPVPVWCADHCPDCRTGELVPCTSHDPAWAAFMAREQQQR